MTHSRNNLKFVSGITIKLIHNNNVNLDMC